jgi:hypothetical protein
VIAMERFTCSRVGLKSLSSATALLAVCGAGCLATKPEPAEDQLSPRDLTPVTLMKAREHAPVEIVRGGTARAVVYVADPDVRMEWVPKRKGEQPPALKRLVI